MSEEALTVDAPGQLHIPRREPAHIARGAEAVAGVEAQQCVDGVAIGVGVAGARQHPDVVVDLVAYRVVVLPLFVEALDGVGDVVGVIAEVVEDAVVDVPVVLHRALIELHARGG